MRDLLNAGHVLTHPFVIGELSSGHLRNRRVLLDLLRALPQCVVAEHGEALALLESKRLFGRGIGWVDVHLITSAVLSDVLLWTTDRRMQETAVSLHLRYAPG